MAELSDPDFGPQDVAVVRFTHTPRTSGTLVGYADVRFRLIRLTLMQVAVHADREPNGHAWALLPRHPVAGRNCELLRGPDGAVERRPSALFGSADDQRRWSAAVAGQVVAQWPSYFAPGIKVSGEPRLVTAAVASRR